MKMYIVVRDIMEDDLDAAPSFISLEDARHYINTCAEPNELKILEVD